MNGGEQQMLALAWATLSEPSLVVVNEASLGLPPYWPTGWTRASSSTRDPLATAAIPRQRSAPGHGLELGELGQPVPAPLRVGHPSDERGEAVVAYVVCQLTRDRPESHLSIK